MFRKQIIPGFALVFLAGCGSAPPKPDEIAVQVMAPKESNHAAPLYFIVKQTEKVQFYMDDYQKIANLAFVEGGKDESLVKKVIIPGRMETIRIPLDDEKKPVAAYFLFTNPNEEWKIVFDNPECRYYKIRLGKEGIEEAHGY